MAQISLETNHTDATKLSEWWKDVNSNFGKIQGTVNGGINASNLENGAVTADKLAAESVKEEKLDLSLRTIINEPNNFAQTMSMVPFEHIDSASASASLSNGAVFENGIFKIPAGYSGQNSYVEWVFPVSREFNSKTLKMIISGTYTGKLGAQYNKAPYLSMNIYTGTPPYTLVGAAVLLNRKSLFNSDGTFSMEAEYENSSTSENGRRFVPRITIGFSVIDGTQDTSYTVTSIKTVAESESVNQTAYELLKAKDTALAQAIESNGIAVEQTFENTVKKTALYQREYIEAAAQKHVEGVSGIVEENTITIPALSSAEGSYIEYVCDIGENYYNKTVKFGLKATYTGVLGPSYSRTPYFSAIAADNGTDAGDINIQNRNSVCKDGIYECYGEYTNTTHNQIKLRLTIGFTATDPAQSVITFNSVYIEPLDIDGENRAAMDAAISRAVNSNEEALPLFSLTDETDLEAETVVAVDASKYYLVDARNIAMREVLVYGKNDGEPRVQLPVVSIATGTKTAEISQTGKYYIPGSSGYEQLIFKTIRSDTIKADIDLIIAKKPPIITTNAHSRSSMLEKPLSTTYTENNIAGYRIIGVVGGNIYGYKGTDIRRTNGMNNSFTVEIATAPAAVSDGIVFENGNIFVVCSGDNKGYLWDGSAWAEKIEFTNGEYPVLPNTMFSYSTYHNVGIVSEYRSSKTPVSGYKAYMTKDHGVSWTEIFDLSDHAMTSEGYHLHSCKYDPYGDMLWACSGDGAGNQMIYYSVDEGASWYKAADCLAIQASEIIPMQDCVLFVSDARLVGVYRWNREPFGIIPGQKLHFDTVKIFMRQWGLEEGTEVPIGCAGYVIPQKNIALFGFATMTSSNGGWDGDELKYNEIYMTNGYDVKLAYISDTAGGTMKILGDGYDVVARSLNNGIAVLDCSGM